MTFPRAVPEIVVPNNLKWAVHRAHRYEPQLIRAYQEGVDKCRVAPLPARQAGSRDKANWLTHDNGVRNRHFGCNKPRSPQ